MPDFYQMALALMPYAIPILITLCVAAYRMFLNALPAPQRQSVDSAVQTAFKFVEQTQALVPSQVKKEIAMQAAKSLLARTGAKLSDDQISALIEAAVFDYNQARQNDPTVKLPAANK